MKHEHIEEKFTDYIDGQLSKEESAELAAHLEGCEDCRKAFQQLDTIVHFEGLIAERRATLGSQFSAQVLEVLDNQSLQSPERFSMVKTLFSYRVGLSLAGVAAAFLAVIVAVTNHQAASSKLIFLDPPAKTSDIGPVKAEPQTSVESTPQPAPAASNEPLVPHGYRAVTISAQSGVEGWAKPKSRADILWSFTQNGKNKVATLSRFVKVLAVTGGTTESTVTVLASDKDAKKIELARSIGKLSLSLSGSDDASASNHHEADPIMSLDDIIDSPKASQPASPQPTTDGVMYATDPKTGRQSKIILTKGKWTASFDVPTRAEQVNEQLPQTGPTPSFQPSPLTSVADSLPPDHRAITLETDQLTGVEGWARPGAHVDVVVTYQDSKDGKRRSQILTENAQVASINGQTANSGKVATTLIVPPQEANKIQTAQSLGRVSLVLRNSDEVKSADNSPAKAYSNNWNAHPWPNANGLAEISLPSGEKRKFVLGKDDRWQTADPQPAEAVQQNPYGSWYQPPVTPQPTEVYGIYEENPRVSVSTEPVSTFGLDVDTGSYTNVRRMLSLGQTPPKESVRIEEFLNYFTYDYPSETKDAFGVYYEIAPSPLEKGRYLMKLGIKARESKHDADKGWNLVFLVDRSGSMSPENRLPLVKRSLHLIVDEMRETDRIAIVAYADGADLVLDSTSGAEKDKIRQAIESLRSGGGTNGAGGIDLAYQVAERNRRNDGVNRIVLATDGDFNVGTYDFNGLMRLVEEKRRGGVTLSTIGVGEGNYNEKNLEQLANRGNGSYFYLDSFMEARKQLVDKLTSYIETVAKDAKIQVEFNPEQVVEYRLIGYDNRKLNREDFSNDAVDAGEIGAGHTVTALYEVVLANSPLAERLNNELRYQNKPQPKKPDVPEAVKGELAFVKIRYKEPNAQNSILREYPVLATQVKADGQTSEDFRFAAAVSYFGQLLRGSRFLGSYSVREIADLARNAKGSDRDGSRAEFIRLVENFTAKPFVPRNPLAE